MQCVCLWMVFVGRAFFYESHVNWFFKIQVVYLALLSGIRSPGFKSLLSDLLALCFGTNSKLTFPIYEDITS